ncbi:MAG TPA: asparagine synthase (glutamine-hydrolyzing) [Allosphingosinicella sp.]|nr:asparagine synthase (glutamine-hydrolyzing) [Allosphingosinicella sp.]
MCGIAGLMHDRIDSARLRRMTDRIAHRGPDDEGAWIDAEAGIGLGHRRLAIIDLSPLGHQPMTSNDGRWVICYNGEIYNHAAIRAALNEDSRGPKSNGIPWRGHSDTETLVEAIAAWGLEVAIQECVGMFALAVWDRKERELHLVRDRFGEKPLYYGWAAGGFVFGSELKAIRSLEGFDNAIDRRAVTLLASRTYIPAPLSIYKRLFKLPPGCILTARADAARQPLDEPPIPGDRSGAVSLRRYWSYRDVVAQGLADPIGDEEEALRLLEETLSVAIRGQSVADVPVGAFLSGGIDSSTVVGLYQKYSLRPVRTFSIGFEEAGFNEAEYAKQVAAHFGAEHNERYVTVRETQEVIPLLPQMYDEPFADSSQIPTHLVSRFAREQVKVALSGDGGDELFGGYNRYFGTARLWKQFKRMPGPLRRSAGRAFGTLPPGVWNGAARFIPGGGRPKHFGTKVQKTFRTMARADRLEGVFDSFLDEWAGERSPAINGIGMHPQCAFDMDVGEGAGDATRMMYCDAVSYLPDDILAKVDRASMAVSLETRVPFLDHRVAAVAARIPERMKIRGGSGKQILKKLLYRQAPRDLFERPKAGFGVPVGEWIKGPLRPWAEELLDPARMKREGFFDPAIVQRRWQRHLSGQSESTPALWAILMFQAWQREAATAR